MPSQSEYNALVNKYLIAKDRIKTLEEEKRRNIEEWADRDKEYGIHTKLTRDFCERILSNYGPAPDPDHPWSKLSIPDLLQEATMAIDDNTKRTSEQIGKVLNKAEERQAQIENLKYTIEDIKRQNSELRLSQNKIFDEEDMDDVEEAVSVSEEEIVKRSGSKAKFIVTDEAGDDYEPEETAMLEDAATVNREFCVRKNSTKVVQNEAKTEKARKIHNTAKATAVVVNLEEYEEQLDETAWKVLELIGKEGISRFKKIEERMLANDMQLAKPKIRNAIRKLLTVLFIKGEEIPNVKGRNSKAYWLTPEGRNVCLNKFGEPPITSEAELIRKEHTTLVHGYLITMAAEEIEKTETFKTITTFNRTRPVILEGGVEYIPDIILEEYPKDKLPEGRKMYIECECNTHSDRDFFKKCNKMATASRIMNFIVKNIDDALTINKKIQKWIENKGQKSLGHVTIRVTTLVSLEGMDIRQNKNWMFVFMPGNSMDPKVNF